MMTLFSMLHRMLNLGETIGCEKDAGKRIELRTSAALEITKWSDAHLAQQPDLAAIREVIAWCQTREPIGRVHIGGITDTSPDQKKSGGGHKTEAMTSHYDHELQVVDPAGRKL